MVNLGPVDKVRGYFHETLAELRKVVWPDRRYVVAATTIIIVIVILLGLFITFIDLGFANIMLFLEKAF